MPGAAQLPAATDPVGAYQEYAPPLSLAPFVECFWSRGGSRGAETQPRSHRVLPDGCVDIIVPFGERGIEGGQGLAVGAMTRPVLFTDDSTTVYLAARFKPGIAGMIFGIPADELTDERIPLAELWRDAEELTDALLASTDSAARARTLSAAIARRLLAAPSPPPAVRVAAERICRAAGKLSIRELAADLGVTRQHLARAFAEHVGLTPKRLSRIVRARAVVELARRGGDPDWSGIAYEAGYYDQSHLIAEVKELTGMTPSAWAAGDG